MPAGVDWQPTDYRKLFTRIATRHGFLGRCSFTVIGKEEQSIRHQPTARRSDLLKKVFRGH